MLLACAGCDGESEAGAPASTAESLRARTGTRFAVADFLKPRMDGPAELDPYLAPLIYLEAPHAAPLGSAFVDGEGRLNVDASRPAVYWADRIVRLAERERRQLTFVWFRDVHPPRAQGVRLTFDGDGFPVITEVLADDSGRRILYVTHGLEARAAEAFGDPLPGRSFAIEGAEDGGVLAGSVGSAPRPLGPYVYQARDANDVTTIHCRCSPTQAGEIREMIEYELVPLEALDGVWPAEGDPGFAPPDSPARVLRLPPGF